MRYNTLARTPVYRTNCVTLSHLLRWLLEGWKERWLLLSFPEDSRVGNKEAEGSSHAEVIILCETKGSQMIMCQRRAQNTCHFFKLLGTHWSKGYAGSLRSSVAALFCLPRLLVGDAVTEPGSLISWGWWDPWSSKFLVVVLDYSKPKCHNFHNDQQNQVGCQESLIFRELLK